MFQGGPLRGSESEAIRDQGLGSACVARDPVGLVAELARDALRGVVVGEVVTSRRTGKSRARSVTEIWQIAQGSFDGEAEQVADEPDVSCGASLVRSRCPSTSIYPTTDG